MPPRRTERSRRFREAQLGIADSHSYRYELRFPGYYADSESGTELDSAAVCVWEGYGSGCKPVSVLPYNKQ